MSPTVEHVRVGSPRRRFDLSSTLVGLISKDGVGNFVALLAAQFLVAGVGLASTRFLTPSDKGLFTAIYLWSLVGETVVGLSLPNALLYFGPRAGTYWPGSRLMI